MRNYLNFKKIELTVNSIVEKGFCRNIVFTFDDIKSSSELTLSNSEHILDIQIKSVDVKKLADSLYDFDPKYIGDKVDCNIKASTNKEEDFNSVDKSTNKDYFRYYLFRGHVKFTPYYSSNELHLSMKRMKNSTYLIYNLTGYRRLFEADEYILKILYNMP